MTQSPLLVLALLLLIIFVSEWLVLRTWARQLGTALLVILFGALLSNLGVIPTMSEDQGLYAGIFTYLAPLSIFFLMLEVNLKDLRQAGLPMLSMFGLGALGTVFGVMGALYLVGSEAFGPQGAALAGMFAGTYIGGAVNFNAVAIAHDMMNAGPLFAGAVAVDNLLTTVWMLITIGLPLLLQRWQPRGGTPPTPAGPRPSEPLFSDDETVSPQGLSLLLGTGLLVLWLAEATEAWFAAHLGWSVPAILVLTTLGLGWAQAPTRWRPSGARLLGLLGVYLFLEVIGALCDVAALQAIGPLAWRLFAFAGSILAIHGLWIFGCGALLRWDWSLISVASQANVGGSTSALALARSQQRQDLVLPAILVGTLGNALGTYVGLALVPLLG